MKLRHSIFAALFISAQALLGQTTDVSEFVDITTFGGQFDLPRGENLEKLQLSRNGNPLIISIDHDHLYIRTIDPVALFPNSSITLSDSEDKEIADYQVIGDSLYALIKIGNKTAGFKYEVVTYRIAGSSQGEVLRRDIGLKNNPNQKTAQPIYFSVSDNGNYTAVCQQTKFLPNQVATFHVSLINNKLGKEQHFSLPTQIEGDDLKVLGMAAADNGRVFLLAFAGIKLNSPFRKKYLLYSFDAQQKTLHEFDFGTDDLFAQDLILNVDKFGVKAIALYHTDPLTENRSNGYAYVEFNLEGTEILNKNVSAFHANSVKAHKLENEMLNANEISNLALFNLVYCNNQPMAIMEKVFKDQICQTDPRTGMTTCTDQFHFNNISIENLAQRDSSIIVSRKQIDYNVRSAYSSQQVVEYDDRLLIFFNDHYKNVGLTAEKVMNNVSRSVMRMVEVSCDGKLKTLTLTDERQTDFVFMPEYEMPRFGQTIYFLTSNGRDYKIGKIDLSAISEN